MSSDTLDPDRLRDAAALAVADLKVLANSDRLLLLCQLSQGERCVGELETLLGIHQPTLSQQLGVLRSEGVVATRRSGKQVFYRVANAQMLRVLVALYAIYCPTGTHHD
ncbi:MAG: metalloregulator ArsR/SmtB family transcription factor [Castellaniella sp.]|uniref:metalloregulator ArsR/SmtB family transcription factor n=1 Tax=Castellaniella sp. TaxID=1955812 RepID=UPI003C71690D